MKMVHLYVVGCGGVGKTTLIDDLVRKNWKKATKVPRIHEVARKILAERKISGHQLSSDRQLFWNFQSIVIKEQIKQQSSHRDSKELISDRCFLDAIVYGLVNFPENFDSL